MSCATLMKVALLLAGAAPLSAQEEPVGAATNRRVMHYLQSLSDADRGKKLTGVRVADGTLLLAGQMLLHRIDYYPTLLRASEGDMAALSRFFARSFEDAPADQYVRDAWAVLHLVGDAPMAEMLTRQPPKGNDVGAMLGEEWTTAPISDGKQYVKRRFPRIYEALYAK